MGGVSHRSMGERASEIHQPVGRMKAQIYSNSEQQAAGRKHSPLFDGATSITAPGKKRNKQKKKWVDCSIYRRKALTHRTRANIVVSV